MKTLALAGALLLGAHGTSASAQLQFDYITFDEWELDPNGSLGFSSRWGLLVNTGTQPISLVQDWEGGLWYAESSAPIGAFFFENLNPYGAGLTVFPGEAVGDNHPLLMAKLQAGETLVGSPAGSLTSHFQLGAPYPTSNFDLDFFVQVDDQLVHSHTKVVTKSLGGPAFLPVSAQRLSSVSVFDPVTSYGAPCNAAPLPRLSLYGDNIPTGPPYAALLSNMPEVGNGSFGFHIDAAEFKPLYLIGVDAAPGSFLLNGCEVLLGFTPGMLILSGQMPSFQVTVPLPIPNNPALAGATVYAQALVISSTGKTTNGLRITAVNLMP